MSRQPSVGRMPAAPTPCRHLVRWRDGRIVAGVVALFALLCLSAAVVPAGAVTHLGLPSGGWQSQGSGTRADLAQVGSTDAAHGWIAQRDGSLLATTDGGLYWRRVTVSATASLWGVAFSDDDHGWAVGDDGAVFATTDGGQTWTSQSGATGSLSDAVAVDATHAWALAGGDAESNGVARTTDGATWSVVDTGAPVVALTFVDALHGWAVGFDGAIVASTDGGATWQPQTSGTNALLQDVSFVDASHGWAAGVVGSGLGAKAILLVTSDGGTTWTTGYAGPTASDFFGIDFVDQQHGWAVSSQFEGRFDTVEATDDGGATWRVQAAGRHLPTGVAMVDIDHGWAIGWDGLILATGNGGTSSDTVAPKAVAHAPAGWHNHPVKVRIDATDATGGSGVVYCEHRRNTHRRWEQGSTAVVDAPAGHWADGVKTVWYRAVDAAGNAGDAKAVKVRIDTRHPWIKGWIAGGAPVTTIDRGGLVVVPYMVLDRPPCGRYVKGIKILLTSIHQVEHVAKVVRIGRMPRNTEQTAEFHCWLPSDTYALTLSVQDAAGNFAGKFLGMLQVR